MTNAKEIAVNQSQLYADVAKAATTIYLTDGDGFEDLQIPFLVIVDPGTDIAEIMLVTAMDDAERKLTVERDMLGTPDVAHSAGALVYEYTKKTYITVPIVDVSTAATWAFVPPKSVVTKISTVLSATIATADAVITCSNKAQAITNGAITIAYDGSALGDIDAVYPTAYSEFNGTTDYLKIVNGGASTNTAPVAVTFELAVL